ncbi:primosomal protein N' [Auritidibacter ignavus]|uniref:primosomal protein N' family DNA-binding protein n=1 Tax=Auritidibacter ignavus TaxID=678932 RepID=UPI002FE5E70D
MPPTDALFDLPVPEPSLPPHPTGWPDRPVAKVLLESPVPHLDRLFDYLIPPDLDAPAQPGVKVKVRFGHQTMAGWLVERTDTISTRATLTPIRTVVSALPVLTEDIYRLATTVAADYAGTVADVLRAAIPPRVAKLERQWAQDHGTVREPVWPEHPEQTDQESPTVDWTVFPGWEGLFAEPSPEDTATSFALSLPSSFGAWDSMALLADAATRTLARQQSSILVVPDLKDLDRLERRVADRVGQHHYARLDSRQGPTQRYRSFLQILAGHRHVVIGTRSAIWAPVHQLGLVAVYQDADDQLTEPRAPYHQVAHVARRRTGATAETTAPARLLLVSPSRSTATQYLVETGQARDISPERHTRHRLAPRVVSTADSFHARRDHMGPHARLPGLAWQAAREGLDGTRTQGVGGPVLVQVHRAGFIPGVFCTRCHAPARCPNCTGPLSFTDRMAAASGELACRWCGARHRDYRCINCGNSRLRAGARGVDRTADELGRAFPQVPVISSSADHMVASITDEPALVVATPGSEPVAPGGYATALLLDGDAQLQREGLMVPEMVMSHWMQAATLVRSASDGGLVVVTATHQEIVGALVRMNPVSFASRTLADRAELGFPPITQVAEVTGTSAEVHKFITGVQLPYRAEQSPWIGPTPVEATVEATEEPRWRALLFYPHRVASTVQAALRAQKAVLSAERSATSVKVRIGGVREL